MYDRRCVRTSGVGERRVVAAQPDEVDVRLYWHPFSIIPWRVRIAVREKGLVCEETEVDIPRSAQRSEAFLRLNPFGQLPVLEDGDLVICESIAILEYLEERYPNPRLLPQDAVQRALVRQLMLWGTDYWPPAWKMWVAPRMGQATRRHASADRAEMGRHPIYQTRPSQRAAGRGAYSLAMCAARSPRSRRSRVSSPNVEDGARAARETCHKAHGTAG
jgi:glutathione S-transferase